MPINSYLDFSEIAGFYSQLAGVLAGFSFAALMAMATVRLGEDSPQSLTATYRPLMCSFFALVATSLNYAVMVGEKERSGRSAAVGAAAGVGFVGAGCLLIFAIFVTLDSVETARPDRTGDAQKAVRLIRRILTLVVPPLFVTLFLPALRDHTSVKYGSDAPFGILDVSGLVAIGVSVAISVFLFLRYSRLRRSPSTMDLLSVPGVCVALASLLATGGYVSFMPLGSFLPDAVPLGELVLVTGLGVVTSIAACRFEACPADGGAGVDLDDQAGALSDEGHRGPGGPSPTRVGVTVAAFWLGYVVRAVLRRRHGR